MSFEQLTGGRFIDLGSRLKTLDEIMVLCDRPFKTCPDCLGAGVIGAIGILTETGMIMLPAPCPTCDGEGHIMYVTDN